MSKVLSSTLTPPPTLYPRCFYSVICVVFYHVIFRGFGTAWEVFTSKMLRKRGFRKGVFSLIDIWPTPNNPNICTTPGRRVVPLPPPLPNPRCSATEQMSVVERNKYLYGVAGVGGGGARTRWWRICSENRYCQIEENKGRGNRVVRWNTYTVLVMLP